MKRIFIAVAVLCTTMTGFAQEKTDTIKIGGMVIIRKAGNKDKEGKEYKFRQRKSVKPSNLRTNWWIVDLGFANYTDNTDYGSVAAQEYAPGSNNSWLHLRTAKSVNVNIWFFMQRLNMIEHVVNLQYGLGLELNNYRYKEPIRYDANPPAIANPPVLFFDNTANRSYKKDKLAADYLTIPLMLNFNLTPKRHSGFGFSAGVSAGWLYSARNKTITSDEGKKKAKDDFDLERWKLSYIGELSLGPVKLYGSLAMKNMYNRGLDVTPYNVGIRFSQW
jgi:hypothetical protein